MKLATYNDGSRDGHLVVVSRDLSLAHFANGIATRLQQVLDDWNFLSPQLQDLSVALSQGKARHAFPFDPRQCMAPLPRAFQWASGLAYLPHVDRMRQAHGAVPPASATTAPLMAQGGSDDFLGPCQDAWFGSTSWGIDFDAALAVITGDVAVGANEVQGLDGVRLLLLANGWSLRALVPAELAGGFGLVQSRPATAFGPVAVTPDELGEAWSGGRVHLALQSAVNGQRVGLNDAGPEMRFHFGQLIAHLAKTRPVRAGSIIGSGTVSNQDLAKGFACIAERRAVEAADLGAPTTPYLAVGDVVRLEVKGRDGLSVFGAIEQRVAGPPSPQSAVPEPADGAGHAPAA